MCVPLTRVGHRSILFFQSVCSFALLQQSLCLFLFCHFRIYLEILPIINFICFWAQKLAQTRRYKVSALLLSTNVHAPHRKTQTESRDCRHKNCSQFYNIETKWRILSRFSHLRKLRNLFFLRVSSWGRILERKLSSRTSKKSSCGFFLLVCKIKLDEFLHN